MTITTPTSTFVQLPDDSGNSGKKIDNTLIVNEAAISVLREAVSIGDPAVGSNRQTVNGNGGAGFSQIPHQISQFAAASVNFAASGDNTIIAGVAGKSIKVYRLMLVTAGATNLEFKDNTTALSGPIPCGTFGGVTLDNDTDPWFTCASGDSLVLNSSQAVQVGGMIYYVQN
jgi:hypothetical protein